MAGTEWMLKDDERLIKLTLKGLIGPITVKGVEYPGQVPMTPFEYLLKDDEISISLIHGYHFTAKCYKYDHQGSQTQKL